MLLPGRNLKTVSMAISADDRQAQAGTYLTLAVMIKPAVQKDARG